MTIFIKINLMIKRFTPDINKEFIKELLFYFSNKIKATRTPSTTTLHHSPAAFHHINCSATKKFDNLILQFAKPSANEKR